MRASVRRTAEFERVEALPRRDLQAIDAEALAREYTEWLREPGADVALLPAQALALDEAVKARGLVAGMPVGFGKTLLFELLPVVLESKRPVLVVPAVARDKTYDDRRSFVGKWRLSRTPAKIVSREELATRANARLLEQLRPDLIMIDECDELANANAGAALRIDRYIQAHDECDVAVGTGTLVRKSIMNYWHFLCWALGDAAPVPENHGEATMWAAAIDDHGTRNLRRPHPGPMGVTVREAREWYAKRLRETQGVVLLDGDSCDQPLTVRVRLAREDPEIDAHYKRFLRDNENPAGIPVSDGLSRWRLDLQQGSGYFIYWDPPPPDEWRLPRIAFARFVREQIEASQRTSRPLDTRGQVEAVVAHRFADHPVVVAWHAAKDLYNPAAHTKFRWLSDSHLRDAEAWLAESGEPGIAFTGSPEFGAELARRTGLSYYGAKGRDASGRGLHRADQKRSMVVSWNAGKRIFNLQAWRRMALFQPPQSARYLEQIFGRSHRQKQDRPVVADVFATSGGVLDGFEAACSEAHFAQGNVGMTQKLLRADVQRAPAPPVTATNTYRWARR